MASTTHSQRLLGKVAIVTGSSSGLGRAIALAYSKEGAIVVCTDLRAEARKDVETEVAANTDDLIKQNGGTTMFVRSDMTVAADVEALVEQTVSRFGRLDM
jgi:NAD(P)-dependent dehydrogenase (short-subunit alcohol dehydrogenase family)